MRLGSLLPLALAAALGVLVGLGGFTFLYARGYSYLSDDPAACVNCHIMRDNFDTWGVSSHRFVSCNGCHTPHMFLQKYLVKAENGFSHSFAFTFEDTQVIRIRSQSLELVEENCADCHRPAIGTTFLGGDPAKDCTRCHPNTGHVL